MSPSVAVRVPHSFIVWRAWAFQQSTYHSCILCHHFGRITLHFISHRLYCLLCLLAPLIFFHFYLYHIVVFILFTIDCLVLHYLFYISVRLCLLECWQLSHITYMVYRSAASHILISQHTVSIHTLVEDTITSPPPTRIAAHWLGAHRTHWQQFLPPPAGIQAHW